MSFGPWCREISDAERTARLRSLLALSLVFCRSQQPFIEALAAAANGDEAALELALKLSDQVPAVPRRRLLLS
jgi:hypothetical protein